MNKQIIISGNAGSGKSTIGMLLSKETGIPFISAGQIIRNKMREMKMDIIQFQDFCKNNPNMDIEIDNYMVNYLSKLNSFIADYRLGFHFFPDAFSILLNVSDKIAIDRIKNRKSEEEKFFDLPDEQVLILIQQRNAKMRERFIELYDADYLNEDNYSLLINTDCLTPSDILFKILN